MQNIAETKSDGKKFWKFISKEFCNEKGLEVREVYSRNTKEILKGTSAAKDINKYFCEVSIELSNKFGEVRLSDVGISTDLPTMSKMNIVGVGSVTEQINGIDTSKSSGICGLPTKLLKLAFQTIPDLFTELQNGCIQNSIFLEDWKLALLVLISKKDDHRELNNLRPIFPPPGPWKDF